jgi:hypothetical protein
MPSTIKKRVSKLELTCHSTLNQTEQKIHKLSELLKSRFIFNNNKNCKMQYNLKV